MKLLFKPREGAKEVNWLRLAVKVVDPGLIVVIDSVSAGDNSVVGATLMDGLKDFSGVLELIGEVDVKAGAKFSELETRDEAPEVTEGKISEMIIDSVDKLEGSIFVKVVSIVGAIEERPLDGVVIAEQAEIVMVIVSVKVAART